jgi:hypothetical protein
MPLEIILLQRRSALQDPLRGTKMVSQLTDKAANIYQAGSMVDSILVMNFICKQNFILKFK